MPFNNLIMLNLEIFCNLIYKEGIKYIIGVYNIPSKACRKLPDKLAVLYYCLGIYPLII